MATRTQSGLRARSKLLLVALVGVVVAIAVVGWIALPQEPDARFERAAWIADTAPACAERMHRRAMVSDLMDNVLKVGLTQSALLELLGSPDRRGNRTSQTVGWDYVLGAKESDCEFLYVGFDSGGRLAEWHRSP